MNRKFDQMARNQKAWHHQEEEKRLLSDVEESKKDDGEEETEGVSPAVLLGWWEGDGPRADSAALHLRVAHLDSLQDQAVKPWRRELEQHHQHYQEQTQVEKNTAELWVGCSEADVIKL